MGTSSVPNQPRDSAFFTRSLAIRVAHVGITLRGGARRLRGHPGRSFRMGGGKMPALGSLGDLTGIAASMEGALKELLTAAGLRRHNILVLGGSTSEILGERIGTRTSSEVGRAILDAVLPLVHEADLYLAVQGCEHINRALVVERSCAEEYGLEVVSVYPYEHAGGGLATAAMAQLAHPVVVEDIQAQGAAGIDLGDAFIGMHIRAVGVPVRSSVKAVGEAHLSMIRTRPKLIGGARARYSREEALKG